MTRARPGAEATAERLRALGHIPWVAPLLAVEALAQTPLSLEGAGALAFTSANAVRAFTEREPRRDLPVFAVGETTAAAARAAGFAQVQSAEGDVAALGRLIATAAPCGQVLHPGAQNLAGDLAGALGAAGVPARAVALYRTVVCAPQPSPPATLAAVLVHSPRAAGALAGHLARRPEGLDPGRLDAFGLSPACLAPLRGSGLRSLRAAGTPDETALLSLLA